MRTQFLLMKVLVIFVLGTGLLFNPVLLGGASPTKDWTYFHGPKGDNISKEKGLLKKWPEAGPELLWTAKDLGIGYSSVIIADQMIFTAGSESNQTYVIALDYGGKLKWKKPNGKKWSAGNMFWAKDYDGARATPTFSDGLVYHLGEMGVLTAFNASNGSEVWSTNVIEKFSGQLPRYGYSESLLIDGKNLICYPGGEKGYMVALDKKTGKTLWANKDIKDAPGYDSPILVEDHGLRQIIAMTTKGVVGVNADNGQFLWRTDLTNKRELNIANPIYYKEQVCISSGYGAGTMLIKLTYSGKKIKAEQVWFNDQLDNHHGGIMLLDGYIYGTGHNKRGWFCLDFKTGKTVFREGQGGKGSFMYADGLFYYLTERGKMNLVEPSKESFKVISSFQVPKGGKGLYWAHPVVCNGRLYIRHDNKLFAYKIK
jgi:outer membrane protein assembly factor BamB